MDMDISDLILLPSPFSATPNPRSFYTNACYEEGYERLLAALRQRKGLILLTGEPGTGKTTLLRRLLLALDETAHVTFLPCAAPTFQEIISHLCEQCCPSPINRNPWTQLSLFHDYLQSWNQHGGLEALFIDEAQHLSTETLDQLYLLMNLDGKNGKLLQIILAGHPEFESMLSSPELRYVQQRIATRYRLLPLAEEEVGSFIQHRLRIADCPRLDLFALEAEQAIARYSGGIPRLINVICDAALFAAARAGLHVVTAEIVIQVAQTLQLQPPSSPYPAREPIGKKTHLVPGGFGPEPQTVAQATPLIVAGETNRDSAAATQSALPESTRTQRRFYFIHHWRQHAVQLSLTVILAWLSAQLLPFDIGQIEISPQKTLQAEKPLSSVQVPIREPAARAPSIAPRNERAITPLEAPPTNERTVTPLEAPPTEVLSLVPPVVPPSSVQTLDPPSSTFVPSPSQPALTQPSQTPQQQQLQMATASLSPGPALGGSDNQRQLSQLSDIPSGGENFLLSSSPQIPSNASVSPSSSVIPGRASRGQRGTQAAPLTLASPWSSKKAEARARLAALGLTANSATLYRAVDNGSVNTVDLLLKAGVSPNSQNARGWTALMFAARGSSLDIVELLLARGAQPNMRNEIGATALIIAARENHAAIAQALLRRGATVNAKDRQGRTALMHAAEMGHAVTARTLLNNGANPRLASNKGWTALRYAAQEKRAPLASSQLHPNTPRLLQRFGQLWKQTVSPDKFDEVLTLLQQAEMRHYSQRSRTSLPSW
jgi:type II secretory pathway predicted ATPase ExeA